jgi:mRNA-degrading endonuclease RelE of RelBE toxin-antitoxin system
MIYKASKQFWKDYQELPPEIQKKAKNAFSQFKANPRHPSLETHPIRGTRNPKIFEGYITKSYRFTFHYDVDSVVFRRIGDHSIIDKGDW